MNKESAKTVSLTIVAALVILGLAGGCFAGYPVYKVYKSRKDGEAQFAQAQSNRNISILEANAKKEAAKALADADIARAHGIAEANRIVGRSLKDNPEYLKWLYIEALKDSSNSVIYVPTEASMPLMLNSR